MAAIAALAEVMRDERYGPIGHQAYIGYASDIFDTARHALQVLDGALSDNEADKAGDGGLEMTNVVIGDVVARTVAALQPLAKSYGVGLTCRLPENAPLVVGNARSLRQVILNLVANGLRHTPPGGCVNIDVMLGGGALEVVVHDTGDGIGGVQLDGLRAQLAGVVRKTRRPFSGGGIGLPLVGALVKANGATADIESECGLGTSVRVTFPADRVIPV